MDAIVFRLKRAHLCVQHRFAAKLLKPCALTPARFDLMFAMMGAQRPVTQAELYRELGVSRPTISRMLRSLEALNFVKRWRFQRGIARHVFLTKLGINVLRHARRRTMAHNFVRRVIDRTIAFTRNIFRHRCELESTLWMLSKRFADRAMLIYPWHPDD